MTAAATRILLIEDSEDDALILRDQLELSLPAFVMERVANAADMKAALRHDWDVVISDHIMPGFDAFRALNVLKSSGRDIPFIIYSGGIEQERCVNAMQIGAEDVVDKSSAGRLIPVLQRTLKNVEDRRACDWARSSDGLTGLPNRMRFSALVGEALAGQPGSALIYLDVDRFMRINDSFGYATGDALLRDIAGRLQAQAQPGEPVGRISHDEFALLANVAGRENARLRAETIQQRCFAEAFQVHGQSLFLTASCGVAMAPEDAHDAESLVRNAESAMVSAKRIGRNSVQFYVRGLNSGSSMRLRLESALRQAVSRNELFLVYQPIIDVPTGAICAAEALVRWRLPGLGLIPPDQFISIADESGQIREIGEWVLRTAAAQARTWHERGWNKLSMAVNFSAAQFKEQGFEQRVRRILDEAGLEPRHLELEITETLAMQDAESTAQTLARLKELGVRVSIDDFGTGYSSLGYLRRFPIDILKIDRSFVRDADRDPDSAAIVRTIIALARSLKLVVLAEGVETREHYELLAREGVDRMQGYYFAKPCEADAFESLLRVGKDAANRPSIRAVA